MGALTLLRYPREVLIGLLLLTAVGLCRDREARIVEAAVQQERVQVAESRAQAFEIAAAQRDTVFATDTVRLDSLVTLYDTARVRDTVTVNDTVYVPRAVADATIAGCRIALASCTELVEAERDVSENLRDQLALAPQKPGFWARQYERWDGPAGLLIGLIAGSR